MSTTRCGSPLTTTPRCPQAELAAAAETMANDNVLLTGEVMSLRESAKLADGHSTALEERVRKLQELYTTGVDAIQESEEHAAGRLPVRFWDQLATAEVLARSRPPTDFPLPALNAAPQPWEQVREFQRVREDNQALEGEVRRPVRLRSTVVSAPSMLLTIADDWDGASVQLKDASRKLREARQAHAVVVDKAIADKRTAREALNHQQSQLVGSLRRIQWLVEQQKAALAREEERRAYIQQLEKRLLNQHRCVCVMGESHTALPRVWRSRERGAVGTHIGGSQAPAQAAGKSAPAPRRVQRGASQPPARFTACGPAGVDASERHAAAAGHTVPRRPQPGRELGGRAGAAQRLLRPHRVRHRRRGAHAVGVGHARGAVARPARQWPTGGGTCG